MDNYLESLVLKSSVESVEKAIEEPVEAVEETVVETAEPEQIVSASTDVADEVEIYKDIAESNEVDVEEAVVEEIKEAVVNKAATLVPENEVKKETKSVASIRLFNRPDPSTPFKFYTGNVIVSGKVANMTAVDYMKPGIGLVKGFTPDIQ